MIRSSASRPRGEPVFSEPYAELADLPQEQRLDRAVEIALSLIHAQMREYHAQRRQNQTVYARHLDRNEDYGW